MECLVVFYLLLLITFFTAIGAMFLSNTGNLEQSALRSTAFRFHGRYIPGGWFRHSCAAIKHGGASAVVRIIRRYGKRWLETSIDWKQPGFRCEIFHSTDDVRENSASLHGLRERRKFVSSGGVTLVAFGDESPVLDAFLSEEVRSQIEHHLQPLPEHSEIALSVRNGRLVIAKHWPWSSLRHDMLGDVVFASLHLYDLAQLTRETGIQFVDPAATYELSEIPKCAVCGEEIADHIVHCRRCRSPHHRDCWQYNGSCGMYACNETLFH